jgi:hypothetical protein
MTEEISEFIHAFKNKTIEAPTIAEEYSETINNFAKNLKDDGLYDEHEENFFTILGYSYRLDDIKQGLFFTFQEAVYAIDLDKLMRNEDSLKLNSIVYILVIDYLINEYKTGNINEDIKQKALKVYKEIQEKKSKEDQKYHMYQY